MSWLSFLVVALAAYLLWRRHAARRRAVTPIPPVRVPPPQRKVTETVSVILRRQVPPRDEAPRSWLGGLPMLPDGVAWPRSVSAEHPERGERPLHFVAQIACADFPEALWGGLGPRQGWLLFFVDPNQGVPEGPDAFRVLHVDALGPEGAVPADLGPVHDGVYTGFSYTYCRNPDEVPRSWRRWPVDLVTVPNELRQVGPRMVAAPEDLAAQLYPGQPITRDQQERPAEPEPFTWRGALYLLNSLERSYSMPPPELRIPETVITRLHQPGLREEILRVLDERQAQWEERQRSLLLEPEPADPEERARRANVLAFIQERTRQRGEISAFLDAHPTGDSILDYFRQSDAERKRWDEAARDRIAAERLAVEARDLDAPIDAAAWQAIQERLQQDRYVTWVHDSVEWNGARHFGLREIVSRVDFGRSAGGGELLADYYTDPKRRALIPLDLLAAYEPYWRMLDDNMPHRIGGYHDGVQSDPRPGPVNELLLFQIVSDPAMTWSWGDDGAYYVFIKPDDLERGDFDRATITLECH